MRKRDVAVVYSEEFKEQIFEHKYLDPKCITEGCQSLLLGERITVLEAELARLRTDLKFANIEANHQKETVVSLHASLKQAERELAEGRARLDWVLVHGYSPIICDDKPLDPQIERYRAAIDDARRK